jgi:diamine N-acetyltransferase
MEIRRALPEDAPLLAALNRHVHDPHVAAEPSVYRPVHGDDVAAWFRERLTSGDVALIASDGADAVGYVMSRIVDKPGHLFAHPRRYLLVDQLAVADGLRRRGVGRALMSAVEDHARSCNLDAVELDVRGANVDAVAFYSTLGYRAEQLHLRRPLAKS